MSWSVLVALELTIVFLVVLGAAMALRGRGRLRERQQRFAVTGTAVFVRGDEILIGDSERYRIVDRMPTTLTVIDDFRLVRDADIRIYRALQQLGGWLYDHISVPIARWLLRHGIDLSEPWK